MRTSWNDEEDELLNGLPLRAQIIYLRGLRRYMNYDTGIVGDIKRRISLKMLGEIAEHYENKQRIHPNKKQVIVSLDQLKKVGLIERIEDKDFLIFFLCKADTNKSVSDNHGTTTAQPRHSHHGTEESSYKADLIDNHGTTTAQPRHSHHGTHQESGYQDNLSSINTTMSSSAKTPDEVSVVFDFWRKTLNHPKSKLDDKRKKKIKQAIGIGYSIDEIKNAIIGCSLTPHNMGENDNGQIYDDICLILKDAGQIDRFIRNSTNPPKVKQTGIVTTLQNQYSPKTAKTITNLQEWMQESAQ